MADPRNPIGEIIRNLILLQRLGNGVSSDVSGLIDELFDDIVAQLARIDPTAPGAERYRRARVEKVLGIIEEQTTEAFDEVFKQVRQNVAAIGAQQATWASGMLEASIGTVAVDVRTGRLGVNMMKAIIDRDPMQGLLLRDWFTGQSEATVKRVRRQIQLGMMQNETLDDIVRRVRGRAVGRGNYVGGVLQTTTREANAIVRTAINDIANTAHMETWRENADIAPKYQIVATLDSRTTPICRAKDGEVHNVDDEGAPRPPFHVGCRTVTVPIIDWKGLGIDPPEPGMRASETGPVPADLKYDDWMRRQPAAVQDEILGPGRAELFRSGQVSLRDMIRQDGTVVRLDQLRSGSNLPPMNPPRRRRTGQPASIPGWQVDMDVEVSGPEAARQLRDDLLRKYGGDPDFAAFVEGFDEWQFHDSQPIIRRDLREYLRNGSGREAARQMLVAVSRADSVAPVLYRGMSFDATAEAILSDFSPGRVLDWEMVSFSTARSIAEKYAGWGVDHGRDLQVIVTLKKGAQAIRVENLSFSYHEREWITMGRFRVLESYVDRSGVVQVTLKHVGVPDVR